MTVTVKEYLKGIKEINRHLCTMEEELSMLKAGLIYPTSPKPGDKVQNGSAQFSTNPMDVYGDKLNDYYEEWDYYIDKKQEARRFISKESVLIRRDVLIQYYILNKRTWDDVAKALSYTTRQVQTFHGEALQDLEQIAEKERITLEI